MTNRTAAGRFRCVRCGGEVMPWRESDPRCLVCEKSYPLVDGIVALTEATKIATTRQRSSIW